MKPLISRQSTAEDPLRRKMFIFIQMVSQLTQPIKATNPDLNPEENLWSIIHEITYQTQRFCSESNGRTKNTTLPGIEKSSIGKLAGSGPYYTAKPLKCHKKKNTMQTAAIIFRNSVDIGY